jgi:flagellar biosynthesis/type III secretory pathway protein FliH
MSKVVADYRSGRELVDNHFSRDLNNLTDELLDLIYSAYLQGLDEGYTQGEEEGYNTGYEYGRTEGYDEGYDDARMEFESDEW